MGVAARCDPLCVRACAARGAVRACSEPEAQVLRDLAAGFKPHAWVNVHSGMEALFTPWDHKGEVGVGRVVCDGLAQRRAEGTAGRLAHS